MVPIANHHKTVTLKKICPKNHSRDNYNPIVFNSVGAVRIENVNVAYPYCQPNYQRCSIQNSLNFVFFEASRYFLENYHGEKKWSEIEELKLKHFHFVVRRVLLSG